MADTKKIKQLIAAFEYSNATELKLINCGLSNLKTEVLGWANLITLREYYLPKGQERYLRALHGLTILEALWLKINNPIMAARLASLQELDLKSNLISDLSPLAHLSDLKYLHLRNNRITDLKPLAELKGLQTLDLRDNQISDLSPLTELVNLQQLGLGKNKITDLSPLAHLTGLQKLHLYTNQLTDLSPLAQLTGLQELVLYNNRISDISPLAGLINLQRLALDFNQLTDLSALLPFLRREKNPLQLVLKTFASDGEINVGHNPLINPPIEVIQQGWEAVLNYFVSSQQGKTQHLNETKPIIQEEVIGKPVLNPIIEDKIVVKQVFVSYSKEDKQYLKSLKKHLSVMKAQGLISVWDDTALSPGEDWNKRIQTELLNADVILILVSANSLFTHYIYNQEITMALDRQQKGEAIVIPIILSPCDWKSAPFGYLSALPPER